MSLKTKNRNRMPPTKRGYDFYEVSSAMQKAIRRGDATMAGYWALELFESGYSNYVWKRLLTITAEDMFGLITREVLALRDAWLIVSAGDKFKGRIFVSKAVILLCAGKKSRDSDHLQNLVYDAKALDEEKLLADLEEARQGKMDIPDYAYDCHTQKGKRNGATKARFFRDEHAALTPRETGLF